MVFYFKKTIQIFYWKFNVEGGIIYVGVNPLESWMGWGFQLVSIDVPQKKIFNFNSSFKAIKTCHKKGRVTTHQGDDAQMT